MKLVSRILLLITGSIIIMIFLLFIIIQLPAFQNFARIKIITVLQNKIGTGVDIKKLYITFPNLIILEGICFEDRNQDTLLAGDAIIADISIIKLFKKQLQINKVDLQGITIRIQRTLPDSVFNFDYILKSFIKDPDKPIASDTLPGLKFSIDRIRLSQMSFLFKDELTANDFRGHLNNFETRFQVFDLDKMIFSAPLINLSGLNATVVKGKMDLKKEVIEKRIGKNIKNPTDISQNNNLIITLRNIALENINLKYDDLNKPELKQGIDYAHLRITRLNLKAETFSYSPNSISGSIAEANLKNKDDFILSALKTNITYSSSDSLSNLTIHDFNVKANKNTVIDVSGNISGLPDPEKIQSDLNVNELRSGRDDLNELLPAGLIPESILLPDSINFKGKFKGGLNSFETIIGMTSGYGNAKISAGLTNGNQKGSEAFNISIELVNFNAGKLIRLDSVLGLVSVDAMMEGTGFDPKTMNGTFNIVAASIEAKGYTYKNLVSEGNIANQSISLKASMNDPNLKFNMNGKANLETKYPSVNFILNLDTLNLQKLQLYDSVFIFHAKVVTNLASSNPDSLIGTISASNLLAATKGKIFSLDSINMIARVNGNYKELFINSEIAKAKLLGEYNLSEMGNVLNSEIYKYFKPGYYSETLITKTRNFSFTLDINNKSVLQELIPLLTHFEPLSVKGNFNLENGLKVEASSSQIVYGGSSVDNINMILNNSDNALKFNLSFDKITSSSFRINKTRFKGTVQNNTMALNLIVKDQSDVDKFILAGVLSERDGQYRLCFNKDSILLNYDPWTVISDNFIEYGSKGIMAGNLNLSSNSQKISVNSNPQQINAPLTIDFANFRLSTFSAFSGLDTLLADGIINGKIILNSLKNSPVFFGDISIKTLTIHTDTIGDIRLKVNNSVTNTFATNISISGNGNDIDINGEYYAHPENKSSFNADLNISKLKLATIEGFTNGILKNASGDISGKLNINGTIKAPSVNGNLLFNKATFIIATLNSQFTIENEKINFTSEGLKFDTFTLVDPSGNKAIIDGSVFTTNFRDFRFGLVASTQNFKIISSTKKDNRLFWGNMFLNSNLRIGGNIASPVVEGSIKINGETDFNVVIPQNTPGIAEREGIVDFTKADIPLYESDKAILDSVNTSTIKGMDISVNIEVDSNAVFNIIIDEGRGDFLKVQGDARLSAGIDQSGKVNLSGAFEITKGTYELSLDFMKRKFIIQNGSVITWQGEPTSAEINISAIYLAKTAPYDLVASQLNESPALLNRYKQKLPFEVILNLEGKLMSPIITFDIKLPNQNYSVARDVIDNVQFQLTRLKTQPSDLNKQVFALLLLNRFVAENPFISGAGITGAESLARSSASKLLSEQLNQLAGNLIQGVDLNFDLASSEDYTTGSMQNRTELNVGVSKQLINERLKVNIGSNFELEGPRNANQNVSNFAGNMALDYQLSKDGRYMLRAYRKNEYQGVVEGYLTETGMGFIFTLDYKSFKELFIHKKKDTGK